MLLVFMDLLRMLGPVTPPVTPGIVGIDIEEGGRKELEARRKRIEKDDDEIFLLITAWMISKHDN